MLIPLSGKQTRDASNLSPVDGIVPEGTALLAPMEGSAALLAPAMGRSLGITSTTLTNGQQALAIEFEPHQDADPVWNGFDDINALDLIHRIEPEQFVEWLDRIRLAGIHADRLGSPDLLGQLHQAMRRPIDTILCNVLDVDPGACVNAAIGAWHGIELVAGVALLARIVRAGRAVVATDARAPESWSASMRRASRGAVKVVSLIHDYPQSDPTLMLYTLLGRRLRPGRLPVEQGVIQLDAPAAVAIGRAALQGASMLSVPVAVRDHVLRQSFFVYVPVGMRIGDVMEQTRAASACSVIRGGDVLRNLQLPADAVVGPGELVLHGSTSDPLVTPDPCVRCGWCVEACPTRVQPAAVLEAAQSHDVGMAESYGLDACIECGICSYVCPSRLPLLDGIKRIRAVRAKSTVRG